jgi:hypothetical protein
MDLVIIERESAEWNYMWEWLENHPINEGIENPRLALNNGELWQYMSSYYQNGKILHEFRHKNHPKTNNIQRMVFEGSDKFNETQIAVRKKVR